MELSSVSITPHQLFSLDKELQRIIHDCCLHFLGENNWSHYTPERLEALEFETLQFLQSKSITSMKMLQQELPKLMALENTPPTIQTLANEFCTRLSPIQIDESAEVNGSNNSSLITTPNNSEAGYSSEVSDRILQQSPRAQNQFEIFHGRQFEHAPDAPKVVREITKEANRTYLLKRAFYFVGVALSVIFSGCIVIDTFLMVSGGVLLASGATRMLDVPLFCALGSECEYLKQVGNILSSVGLPLFLASFFAFWILLCCMTGAVIMTKKCDKSRRVVLKEVVTNYYELDLISHFELIEKESSHTCTILCK